MLSAVEQLGPDGPLARLLKNFAPRVQQQEMAQAVARALDENSVLVTEAGTGTGKTFAYLVPALLAGKKVVISTGTKTLQEQLFHRDLPLVRDALAVPATVAMLKGRANYLCTHRLGLVESSGSFKARESGQQYQKIRQWAGITRSGDIAEVSDIPEDASIWSDVTSTQDNCLGQECPSYSSCHVMKARSDAMAADVVVINHYLLFADMMLKDEGFGELLPGAQAFILDEAHQLADIASNFFGISLSGRQLIELGRDTVKEYLLETGDMPELPEAVDQLEKAVYDFRLALGIKPQRAAWKTVKVMPKVYNALQGLDERLAHLRKLLEAAAVRGKGLENCWRRSIELYGRLSQLCDDDGQQNIGWFETTRRGFVLRETPLDIGEPFSNSMARYDSSWIFTSATLAVGNSFDHFTSQLGLDEVDTGLWGSPFDYESNSLLYVPKGLPDPRESDYTAAVVDAALPVVRASSGRAFILFTSHRALKQAAELFESLSFEYPLLVQGSAPRSELLERFRKLGNAVLLGTSSFWEGVDVRGQALSCVVIDKLPFEMPDDPVLQARNEVIRQKGGNPFMDYLLPRAVITLKQGAGRLIRDEHDQGVLMLCDPRIRSKSYGRIFVKNLPPMPRTQSLADVEGFYLDKEPGKQSQLG